MSKSRFINFGGLLLACFAAGFFCALFSVQEELLVDFDSGALRQRIHVGPFVVRDQRARSHLFQHYSLRGHNRGITGTPDWHVALRYRGNGLRSPDTIGGSVLNSMTGLGQLFPMVGRDEAGKLKEGFLRALAREGSGAASRFAFEAANRLLGISDEGTTGERKQRPAGVPSS